MTCPPEIASILLEILEHGILEIRALHQDHEYCFRGADHLHNLPRLIRDYDPARLLHYWSCERDGYIECVPEAYSSSMRALWEKLRPFVDLESGRVPR